MQKYRDKYPEKYKAKIVSQYTQTPKGKERHHWSYNAEHYKDVVFLTKEEHNTLHRYMIYDQERMMYRNLSGVLLDTKLNHSAYISEVLGE